MKKNIDTKHPSAGILYLLSLFFERISYLGIRAVLVIYLIEGNFQYDRSSAVSTYAIFTTVLFFAYIAGGLMGDRIFGNRKAVIYGGFMQALGALIVAIPNQTAFFVGLFFVVMGGALYTPNLLANIGRSYLTKPHLMDSGFTITIGVRTIGALIGASGILFLGEVNFVWAFLVAGGMMLISTLIVALAAPEHTPRPEVSPAIKKNRTRQIGFILLALGVFYASYRLYAVPQESINSSFLEKELHFISGYFHGHLELVIDVFIITALAILWTFYRYSQRTKLLIAAIAVLVGSIFSLLIPVEQLNYIHLTLFIIHLSFLVFANLHVRPIIYSLIMKYGNPRYYATLLSLLKLPASILFVLISPALIAKIPIKTIYSHLVIAMIGMFIYAAIVFFFMKFVDTHKNTDNLEPDKNYDDGMLDT